MDQQRPNLLDFPAEVFLKILLHFELEGPVKGYCTQDLRALSQTCRSLRLFFIPFLWERFEAFAVANRHPWPPWDRVASLLRNRSRGLIQNSDLANYVKVATVQLTHSEIRSALPDFARCLAILHSLHSLHILHIDTSVLSAIEAAFVPYTFPQIRTFIGPTHGEYMLRCCPNVQKVVCDIFPGDVDACLHLVEAMASEVQVLEGIYADHRVMQRIAEAFPNLRYIGFDSWVCPTTIRLLAPLKKLHTIKMTSFQWYTYDRAPRPDIESQLSEWVVAGTDVLRRNGGWEDGSKWLRLRHQLIAYPKPGADSAERLSEENWKEGIEIRDE